MGTVDRPWRRVDGDVPAQVECPGSGSIPEIFDDATENTRFGACSVCGSLVPLGGIVPDH